MFIDMEKAYDLRRLVCKTTGTVIKLNRRVSYNILFYNAYEKL